jgi:Na+-driven multidrug efflux pump
MHIFLENLVAQHWQRWASFTPLSPPSHRYIGLSAGANAAVSQYIGAGNNGDDINRIGLHAISLGLILSLALNPLFIFGWGPIPEMGTSGAAFATMIGRFVAVIIALWIAWRRGLLGVCGNI